ncbi:hypothetical protein F7725_018655 [Dissostichus mawsoni]|uniref:C2H2-type domain-containing protein n=1 Tax=Dissostichus mawsoni TaxID=36200 RepID=A0A7J5XUY3_DISMA|nr:hypothetical protein F7725_018655 [Dissostichus mawsoni]
MQSPTQSPSRPNPGATATQEPPLDTETEAQPAQSDSDEQKEKDEPAAPVMTETVTPQENGTEVQTAETPESLPVTQAVENEPAVQPQTEPSVNSAGVETDSASKPSAPSELVPDTNAKSKCDEKKAKKTDKGVREPRKYIPSKKAMVDPLKMDMSKQPSKERHLKLSHPAEYEQCILRNSLFACYVCDRHFTNSIDLMLHQKAHTEKKPFKCPICSEAFNKSSELTFHKKNHYGQDGYECTDCGKNCKTMTALKYHMRKHSGERPYVCKECGKRFSMSKALQKHMMAQCQGEGGDPTADALKKAIGPSSIKYPCSLCKATFKSTRTRQHHMKTKHNMVPATASKALSAEHQGKHNTPIITPISICQSSLLQAGPNGPLQKVDANIDTEQIRRLIESLGNVQRVNQVVILGQLPPHAAPLELHQMSQLPQTDFMELKPTGSNIVEMEPLNPCFALDQTIILEPITPEGQLENPDFSELGSNITIGENIELTLVQTEQTERPEGEGMHQILQQPDNSAIQFDQTMFQNGVDLEQTVILELIPTEELELPQTVSHNEIPSCSLVNADLQQMAYQTVIDEQTNMSATILVTELELTPLQIEQQGLPYFVPSDTLTHTSGAEVVDSQMQTVSLDQEHPVMDGAAPQETQEKAEQDQSEQEPSEKLPVEGKNGEESEVEDPPAKEVFPSNLETKQVPQVSELPVNVMSAQELVKVRKRNSNKAFILQGCMHELGGSIYKDDFQIDATPSKRQRKKKSHLVVKRSPQSKEKNNKKQKKPSLQHQPIQEDEMRDKTPATILSKKKVPPQKKGRKGKKDKKTKHLVSNAEKKSPSSTQDSQVQQIKEEEEELLVQKKKGGKRAISRNATRGRRRETGRLKRDAISKRALTQASGRHIRWNVEPVNTENTSSPLIESEETAMDESCVTPPEFNTNQCIFYPVKEEEREFLLGAQTNSGNSTTGAFCDAQQTEQHVTDNSNEGCHSAPGYEEMRVRKLSELGVSDSADKQAEAEAEMQHPPDLRDFLLQSSDEEDVGVFEMSDPLLDSEAEVMAYFYKNQTNSAQQAGSDELSQNMPTTSGQIQAPREGTRTTEPIDYFSKYFGWDTWVEIANCTNKISNMPRPVTSREVAQFVGIHVAMGTLKFPSPRLYWENLTKVPLVADSMPLSRFLELSRMLKLACPAKDPVNSNVQEGRCDSDFQNAQQGQPHSSRQSEIGQPDTLNELSSSQTQTDPLWKAQPLLCRFKAGCQSLRQEGDYAVDQYPLPLTGKMHNKKLSLYCTTLVGFGGLLLHVDLKLGQSSKQDAVEKMVPKGSMVFLCKQELSTPAMLERLLVAGVHGAGRVGGARGQIGDEFVSSDGKLMLRRSHCGFILSTAGNNQRNMASLMDNFEKAQMSAQVNRDLQNLYSIPLTASAPTCWPQAVLWYLTDLALVNSWLLYRQDHKAVSAPLTLMAFRLEVSKSLILSNGCDAQDSVPPQTPREKPHTTNEKPNPSLVEESPLPDAATRFDGSGHWPEQLGEGEGGRCRYGDCQRTSRVLCLKCCVFLCISRNHNCFLNFHNQGSLGKDKLF